MCEASVAVVEGHAAIESVADFDPSTGKAEPTRLGWGSLVGARRSSAGEAIFTYEGDSMRTAG